LDEGCNLEIVGLVFCDWIRDKLDFSLSEREKFPKTDESFEPVERFLILANSFYSGKFLLVNGGSGNNAQN
jgi:hypothetical protein